MRAGFSIAMLRLWLVVLVVLSLAACSSAPPQGARAGGAASRGDTAFRTMPPGLPRFVDHSIGREEISIQAMSLVGIPYRWGGNTPESGFDCSGLVKYVVARAADVNLPRTTADISRRGEAVDPDEIAPGDLIFFNTTGRPHSHVGIYVGKLRFVNAPSTGGTVRLDYLTNPYWAKHFDGIRRVAPPLGRPTPFDAPTLQAASPTPTPTPTQTPTPTATATAAATPTLSPAVETAAAVAATSSGAEDSIDAAADAFEPPPSVAVQAEQQARRAGASAVRPEPLDARVQIMRASTTPEAQVAPSSTADDPIARFANSGN